MTVYYLYALSINRHHNAVDATPIHFSVEWRSRNKSPKESDTRPHRAAQGSINVFARWRQCAFQLKRGSFGHAGPPPQHLDRFKRFCNVRCCDEPTDRHICRPRLSSFTTGHSLIFHLLLEHSKSRFESILFVMRIDSNRFLFVKNRPFDSLVAMQVLH